MFKMVIASCASNAGTDCQLMAVARSFESELECISAMTDYFMTGGPDKTSIKNGKPYVSGVCLSDDAVKQYKLVLADR